MKNLTKEVKNCFKRIIYLLFYFPFIVLFLWVYVLTFLFYFLITGKFIDLSENENIQRFFSPFISQFDKIQ